VRRRSLWPSHVITKEDRQMRLPLWVGGMSELRDDSGTNGQNSIRWRRFEDARCPLALR
jgi:hypothetical protein